MKTHNPEFKIELPKIYKNKPQNSKLLKGDIKQVQYRNTKNIRLSCTIFARQANPLPGNLAAPFQATIVPLHY